LGEQQDAFNAACTGREMDVLFEKPGRKPGQAVGRSPYLQAVHVDSAADLIGQIRRVRICEAKTNSLHGEFVTAREAELEGAN
ncbi:MAG: TRAM domain-containing protein, partial [Pseudolabrys sp.]